MDKSEEDDQNYVIDPEKNYVEIDLNELYSLNEYIKVMSSRRARWGGNQLKKKATNYVKSVVEQEWSNGDLHFEWPKSLLFVWHSNRKKDPDNVSSAGRKAILDGFQKAKDDEGNPFLPNDNPRHITGFSDQFVYDGGHTVRVYQYKQPDLDQFFHE